MTLYPGLAALDVAAVAPASPPSGYRTRAKLMVAPDGRVGLFGAVGGHVVVETTDCIVLAPALTAVLEVLRAWIARDAAAGSGALLPRGAGGEGGLVALDLREVVPPDAGVSRVLVTWVVVRGASFRLEALRERATTLLDASKAVLGVAVNFHEGESPQVLGAETMLLAGQRSSLDRLGGSTHRATFGSFVQAHRGQTARVHAAIAAAVFEGRAADDRPRVADLYGGSGSISLTLAARGADVHLIESFGPAVDEARHSARLGGLSLLAEHADVVQALPRLLRAKTRFDTIVVNPPRRGLDADVRARLADLAPGQIVYVSCQPETLARDLDHFARLGYAPTTLSPVDMIPLTAEVETVVVLRRSSPRAPVVLYEDAAVLVVDKPPHLPTTPQGEHPGSLLAFVQALPGGADAVPIHRLDIGTSGVVAFAKAASHVDGWSRALAADDARKTYVTAVRGQPNERGLIDRPLPIDGAMKAARTEFERTRTLGKHALLEVRPEQGRTHQIRRHLAAIGHAVLGDSRYGHVPTNRFFLERHGLDRTFLHAARLELRHPTTGRPLVIDAPLPGDLESVLWSLEKDA